MWTRRQAFFLAPMLLALTMGSTDCSAFGTVTIPSFDTTPPETADAVWRNNEYVALGGTMLGGAITYHLSPGETVIAVASGVDEGGVRKVTMSIDRFWKCCQGNICSNTSSSSTPVIGTQSGSVGSVVSDGVYVGSVVGTLPTCNPGYTLKAYRFAWWTMAEDFHGLMRSSPTHQIVYP